MKLFRFFGFNADEPERELTYEELHPTGARKYLGIFFRNLGKIIKLNFLFLLFCVPVITIPASLAAMCKINSQLIMQEGVFLFSDFFASFKREFVSSLKLFLIGLAGCTPAVLIAFFYKSAIREFTMITVLFGICIIISVFFISYIIIGTKMLPIIDISFSAVSKNSFILAFIKFPINFALVIIFIIIAAMVYVFFPLSLVLIVLPFPSIVNYFTTLIYFSILKKSKILREDGDNPV